MSSKIHVSREHGYMMLDATDYVKSINLPKVFKGLNLKDEFHVSLISAKKLLGSLYEDEDARTGLFATLEDIVKNNDFPLGEPVFDGKLYNCIDAERGRETIIATAKISGLEAWQDETRKYLGNIEFPIPHVTLYVSEGAPGIGLNSKADFDRLAKIMPERLDDLAQKN